MNRSNLNTTWDLVKISLWLGVATSFVVAYATAQQPRAHAAGLQPVALAVAAAPVAAAAAPAAANFTSAPTNAENLHVLVGHSIFVNTAQRLKRIYITDPNVLDSYTASPNQVLCTAKLPGISSLILWDEAGGQHVFLVSSDVDTSALSDALKHALPTEAIDAHGEAGKIVLTGTATTEAIAEQALKLAAMFGKDVSSALRVNTAGVKQVRLKVRIVQVDRAKLAQFGFNFFNAGGKILASTSTTQFPSTLSVGSAAAGGAASTVAGTSVAITNPLNFSIYSSKLNIGATLQDLETKQVAQILAEPTITTVSGQKANFLAGGEFPYPVVQGGVGGLTSITIQFRTYGVKLEFTPNVNPDGTIDLKVAPEVSALDYTNAVTISGFTIPAISTRRAETQVVLRSGQSFAISGLLDQSTTDAYSRTPGIASVPILGQLFKSKNINHTTTELIVVVTPETVDPLTETEVAVEPQTVVPMLDPKTFDPTLPKGATRPDAQPTAAATKPVGQDATQAAPPVPGTPLATAPLPITRIPNETGFPNTTAKPNDATPRPNNNQ